MGLGIIYCIVKKYLVKKNRGIANLLDSTMKQHLTLHIEYVDVLNCVNKSWQTFSHSPFPSYFQP